MLASLADVAAGLAIGFVFGFLLQKGRASRYDAIVGQLLLRDWTLAKITATAVAVGAVVVWALSTAGLAAIAPPPVHVGGVLVGGLLFGVGMAVLGYGPATALVAVGEGKRDARVGFAGMLAGGFAYVVLFDLVDPAVHAFADLGPATWPAVTGSSPWAWVVGVAAVALALYVTTWIRLRRMLRGRS